MTRCPMLANATARFATVVVLPSDATGLVSWSVRIGRSRLMNWIDVRSDR